MACKIKNKNVEQSQIVPGGGTTIYSTESKDNFDFRGTKVSKGDKAPTIDTIGTTLDSRLKVNLKEKDYQNWATILANKNKFRDDIRFTVSDRALAIGKKIICLDKEIFKNGNGDALRTLIKKYWTTDEEGKTLQYLNGNYFDVPFSIEDYNFGDSKTIEPLDIQKQGADIVGNDSVDFISREIQATKITERALDMASRDIRKREDKFFGTQQWVLLKGKEQKTVTSTKTKSSGTSTKNVISADGTVNEEWEKRNFENTIIGGQTDVTSMVLPAIQEKKEFFDYAFEIDTPFSLKELKNFAGLNRPLQADIKLEYNYEITDYETIIKTIDDKLIPNLYIIYSELRDDVEAHNKNRKNANTEFDKIITLNGSLDPTPFLLSSDIVMRSTKGGMMTTDCVLKQTPDFDAIDIIGEYFELYTQEIKKLYTPIGPYEPVFSGEEKKLEQLLQLNQKQKNIAIPITNINILEEFNQKKYMFPMYADIEFSTDRTTVMAEILKDSQLSSTFIYNLMRNLDGGRFQNKEFVEATEYVEQVKDETGNVTVNKKYRFQNKMEKVWNVTEWVKTFSEEKETNEQQQQMYSTKDNIGLFLDKETNETVLSNNPSNVFFRNLMKIIFVGKIRKLIKDRFRTYEEMLNGKLAYSETVLYRVEKRLADKQGNPYGDIIQNFYFPNSNEIDVLRFVDTQVKYGVPYVYTIYAYQSVIGTKYEYDNVTVKDMMAYYRVTQAPSILLVEILYHRISGAVVDNPPVYPDVNIVPYKGVDNQILFLFNGGTGEYYMDPVIIDPREKEVISLFRKIKGYDEKEKIRYKSDDFSGVFQIYRMEQQPSKYEDFATNLRVSVETDFDTNSPQGATAASFVDDINPNKKYYYCFRAVDSHAHFSNPTPVYCVQMINNKGTVFPLIEEVGFKQEREKELVKSLRRFLYIKPKFSQTMIDEINTGIEDATTVEGIQNVFLGATQQRIWGKKLLMRVTSKQTGKIMEFLLNFNHKHIKKK